MNRNFTQRQKRNLNSDNIHQPTLNWVSGESGQNQESISEIKVDMGDKPSRSNYRPDIDGLRSVAVLSVLIFHIHPALLPGGFLGVDIFFVISGYLISRIIVSESIQGTFSFTNFYARRIRRIFPALFVLLTICALAAILLLSPETYTNFMKSARYASAQLANFFFSRDVDYFDEGFSNQPLLHTWSLGVEEQFYLVWPLCLAIWIKIARTLASILNNNNTFLLILCLAFIALLISSFWASAALAENNFKQAFYMFYTRAWEFCIGGVFALKTHNLTKVQANGVGTIGILLIGYSLFFVEPTWSGSSLLTLGVLLPCIGSALLLVSNHKKSFINALLATRGPVFIGKISYSLYLYHWPIIIFYKSYTSTHELSAIISISLIALSLSLATLSYAYVEKPFRRASLPSRKVILLGCGVIAVFCTMFKWLERFESDPWRITAYTENAPHSYKKTPAGCNKQILGNVVFFQCIYNESIDSQYVALIGDSHAPHFFQAIAFWAKKKRINVIQLSVPGCPMLLGEFSVLRKNDRENEKLCNEALLVFETLISKNPKINYVMFAQRYDLVYDGVGFKDSVPRISFITSEEKPVRNHIDFYKDHLIRTFDQLRKNGKEPVILHQVPLFGNYKSCKWEPLIDKLLFQKRRCEYDTRFIDRWQKPSKDFVNSIALAKDIKTYDPGKVLTTPLIHQKLAYSNIDHLNEIGMTSIISHFSFAMDDIYNGN